MNSLQLHLLFARLMHFNFLLLLTQFLYGPHPEHVAGSFSQFTRRYL